MERPANTSTTQGEDELMTTVLTESGEFHAADAEIAGDALWLSAGEAEAATGWVAKVEGLCRGEVCVPLPAGREAEFVRGSRVNVAGLWRHLGRSVAHSERGHVWALGGSARERVATLQSLAAPDFTLPDATGRRHSLSDYRGKKVFLVTWASW